MRKIGRGVGAQVDDYVVDGPLRAANQLGFGGRGDLVMHTTQGAFPVVEREVALNEDGLQTMRRKLRRAEGASEITAIVAPLFEINYKSPLKFRFGKLHLAPPRRCLASSGLCSRQKKFSS